MTPKQTEVYEYIKSCELGATTKQIAAKFGISFETATKHTKKCRLAGAIVTTSRSRSAVWCVPEKREAIDAEIKARRRERDKLKSRAKRAKRIEQAEVRTVQIRISALGAPPVLTRAAASVFDLGAML